MENATIWKLKTQPTCFDKLHGSDFNCIFGETNFSIFFFGPNQKMEEFWFKINFHWRTFVRYRLSCRAKTHLPTFYQHDTSTYHHGVSFKTVKNGGTEMIYYFLCQTLQTRRL